VRALQADLEQPALHALVQADEEDVGDDRTDVVVVHQPVHEHRKVLVAARD